MLKELESDSLREECGVFGIYNNPNAATHTYFGLNALQHRGQEGAGIIVSDGKKMWGHRALGLVADAFPESIMEQLRVKSTNAIGHVRYSTAGGNLFVNVQPFLIHSNEGYFAIAHNGNLVNAKQLRVSLENKGSIFQSTSDTEVVAHLIRHSKAKTDLEQITEAVSLTVGAFAFVILTDKALYAAVDAYGFRPLSLGQIDDGSYVIASETCAFDVVGATFIRDIKAGEIIEISETGIVSHQFAEPKPAKCSMEYLYFAQPNSIIDNVSVYNARRKMGERLWDDAPVEADVIIGVPESGSLVAMGMGRRSGIPVERGLIKNRYIGRSFIQPTQELRDNAVRLKLSVVKHVIEGKRVVVVDDSIVRGTTSKKIVKLLRDAGAKEVHFRSAAPPIISPCFYGINTSTKEELLAAGKTLDEMKEYMNVDSLAFLSIESMIKAIDRPFNGELKGQCVACFTGNYPTELFDDMLAFQEKC
ncbi:MAG: amidophosphoribosyltransferase [Chitinophagaceae bacterium]